MFWSPSIFDRYDPNMAAKVAAYDAEFASYSEEEGEEEEEQEED